MSTQYATIFTRGTSGTDFLIETTTAFYEDTATTIAVTFAMAVAPRLSVSDSTTALTLSQYAPDAGSGSVDVTPFSTSYTWAQLRAGISATTTGIDPTPGSTVTGVFAVTPAPAFVSTINYPLFSVTVTVASTALRTTVGRRRGFFS